MLLPHFFNNLRESKLIQAVESGPSLDRARSLFYFLPQEKNITAKQARLAQSQTVKGQ